MKQKNSYKPVTTKVLLMSLADLEERLDKRFKEQGEKTDRKFEQLMYWINDKITDLKSEFFDKIDPFLKEIEDNREHRSLSANEAEEFKQQLDNHGKRITKLESS